MSRPLLNRRLAGLGTTIFAEMSARAVATGSINLGQGFPDQDGPVKIAQIAADAILAGRGNQYPPGPGIPELRQAIAAHAAPPVRSSAAVTFGYANTRGWPGDLLVTILVDEHHIS